MLLYSLPAPMMQIRLDAPDTAMSMRLQSNALAPMMQIRLGAPNTVIRERLQSYAHTVTTVRLLALEGRSGQRIRTPILFSGAACKWHAAATRISAATRSVCLNDYCSRKKRNRIMHSLRGNWYTIRDWQKPHYKSRMWQTCTNLYNGMKVFKFVEYSDCFEAFVYRRGIYYVFCSDSYSSPKMYYSLRKAVTSSRGEPGCRRRHADPLLHSVISSLRVTTSGSENRNAFGGHSHRGFRSAEAVDRRLLKYRSSRAEARRSYRAHSKGWGNGKADHPFLMPPPPQPRAAVYERTRKQIKPHQHQANNASLCRLVLSSAVAPCKLFARSLRLASWNVEGLREIAKYDQIFSFMQKQSVHLLAMQETHASNPQEFSKSGFLVLHSAAPTSPNHGVGFIVSPELRPYVKSFLPISPRLCSVEINTSPKPLLVYCAYAPSLVQDAAEDVRRKREFWDMFTEQLVDVSSPENLLVMGDFNSRLDPQLDSTGVHIGPTVWGKRLSIDTSERDNAIHLLEVLQSFDLKLPQTFMQNRPARRVTYKETTCSDHFLERPNVSEWTTLDYVITALAPVFAVEDISSHFQQAVNSRHLPIICSIGVALPARRPPPSTPPMPDYTQTSQYYDKLESSLLSLCNHSFDPVASVEGHVLAYTDGSCPNNRVISQTNPAGWGFVVSPILLTFALHPKPTSDWITSHGKVRTNPDFPEFAGAEVSSNNTAELQALIELFDYLLYFSGFPEGQRIHVYTDSQYVLDILRARSLPATHYRLISRLQRYWVAMRITFNVHVDKVPSHVGIPGNEYADRVAYSGNFSLGRTGRFSQPHSRSLRPPEFNPDLTNWDSLSVQEQNVFLRQAISEAKELIPALPLTPHKPWISKTTLGLIAELRDAGGLAPEDVKAFRKRIKASARKDKKTFVHTRLSIDYESTPTQWTTLRNLRRGFTPKPPGIRDTSGKLRPTKQRAEVFREYLANHVWKCGEEVFQPRPPLHPVIPEIYRLFTEEDLYQCLKALQTGKAPGPDEIPAELIKRAPYIVRVFLLSHYNKCLTSASIPDAWRLSNVVMLVKDVKKDTLSLDNYRPVSLSDCFYKIYASLLQKRLAFYIDPRIRDSQFGFRRGRSAAQPIHILRRLIETHERQVSPLHVLFLDWSKAFDSLSFAAIEQSLVRLGVPDPFVRAVMSIYQSPQFRVRDSGCISQQGSQSRGVRQGCPLSPYLFDVVLTCLFHDVECSYERQFGVLTGVLNIPSRLWDLEYADDTVLLSRSSLQLTRLLHLLQHHALQFGLQLNLDKCKHLQLHSENRVSYAPDPGADCSCSCCNGGRRAATEYVPLAEEVKYLGIFLDATCNSRSTTSKRISRAVHASKLLKPFFTHAGLPTKWKLTVYKSIILSILAYGMESCCPAPSQQGRVDSLHFKNLRRIFRVKSSYYHRVLQPSEAPCSNEYLSERANAFTVLPTPSQQFSFNRLKLLGHILRHPDTYEATSTFMQSKAYRFISGGNRSGRPSLHWAEVAMTEAYMRLQHADTDKTPAVAEIHHPYWSIPSQQLVKQMHSASSLPGMDNTRLFRRINPVAQDRHLWQQITKPTRQVR